MYQTNITSTTLLARQVKVRTLQYKFTIFLVAFLLFAFWPQLTWQFNQYTFAKQSLVDTKNTYNQTKIKHAWVLKDVELLKQISNETQKQALIQCYNANCSSLPDNIKDEPMKSAVKAYLQLQKETDKTKFTLDHKKLLTYLNEFLVKSSTDIATFNGEIKWISFGMASPDVPNAIVVPTNLTVSFKDKDWLLGFLRNIEQYISPNFPMLATVSSVSYDIINAQSSQDVSINLNIYMLD
jgi:hypothetical protein